MIESVFNFLKDKPRLLQQKEKEYGNTLIHEASKLVFQDDDKAEDDSDTENEESENHEEEFKLVLKKYKEQQINVLSLKNFKKQSPLHLAAERGSMGKVKVLLQDHSYLDEINEEDEDHNKPIHIAATHKNHKVFKLLLSKSEDLSPVNIIGKTPLHLIAESGADKVQFSVTIVT